MISKKKDASGKLQSVVEVWGKHQTVRKEASEEEKQNTRYNREHGACEKCRKQKLKVSSSNQCPFSHASC